MCQTNVFMLHCLKENNIQKSQVLCSYYLGRVITNMKFSLPICGLVTYYTLRAGQWARRVIINDNINDGTQLPYIERARNEGYGSMWPLYVQYLNELFFLRCLFWLSTHAHLIYCPLQLLFLIQI